MRYVVEARVAKIGNYSFPSLSITPAHEHATILLAVSHPTFVPLISSCSVDSDY